MVTNPKNRSNTCNEIRAEMGFLKTTNSFETKDYNWGLNGGELEIN
jgi:hypothetical protein